MTEDDPPDSPADVTSIDNGLDQLQELEDTVDGRHEVQEVRQAIKMVEKLSPRRAIEKYTTRDMAQTFVGGILLSLPLLVEDGVFDIAEWFVDFTVAGVPVFLIGNVAFVVVLSYGLIYWSDFRQVKLKKILGVFPRRLMAVLTISLLTASFLVFLWGRHTIDDPSRLEVFARITVIWAAAAFGGALGDILPGESRGTDVNEMIEGMLSKRDTEEED